DTATEQLPLCFDLGLSVQPSEQAFPWGILSSRIPGPGHGKSTLPEAADLPCSKSNARLLMRRAMKTSCSHNSAFPGPHHGLLTYRVLRAMQGF
ncbi:hypothetical protein P7K49_009011, partial [Saguinus oedipus]